jgi:PKD repeat protein
MRISIRERIRASVIVTMAVALIVSMLALTDAAPARAAEGTLSSTGAASTAGARTQHTVRIPTTVAVGDLLVLAFTVNSVSGTITAPAGWTEIETVDGDGIRGRVWTRTAAAGDPNANVTVVTSATLKAVVSVASYRSTIGSPTVSASEAAVVNSGATTHSAPAVAIQGTNSWLLNIWGEKSSSDLTWTLPVTATERTTAAATGGGKVSQIVADSNAAVAGPTAAAVDATTSISASRGVQFSLAIAPGSDVVEPGNNAPVASFTASCAGMDCSFDASGSTDADGDPLTYSWAFGDGETATGATAARTYAVAGGYTVTLTVSDGTDTAQTTRQVSPAPIDETVGELSYVGAASTSGARTQHTVRIPTTIASGDVLVLALSLNSTSGTVTAPVGWTEVESVDGNGMRTRVWSKTAGAGDANANVTVTTSATLKSVVSVAAYRSTIGIPSVTAAEGKAVDTTASSHTAPAVAVQGTTSWLVNVWAEKSSTTLTWTLPGDALARTTGASTGTGKVSQVIGDSGAAVAGPTSGTPTATTSSATSRGIQIALAVATGSEANPGNRPPTPSFTATCSGLVCSFDASASTDDDGDPLTFSWNFGDGGTATGATAQRTFAAAGTYSVVVTVSDGTNTALATRQVSPSPVIGGPGHTTEVSDTVLTNMPRITTGEIWDLEIIGERVYVVGGFTSLRNNATGNTTTYNQRYLAAFNVRTGLIDPNFRPVFDGTVQDVEASPDGTKLFVAGRFNAVNGVTKRKFASIDPLTGATVAGWTAHANGAGTELEATNTTVYLGGQFTQINAADKRGLAAVSATTGALIGRSGQNPQGTWRNDISGGIGVNGQLNVQELVLSPDLSTLMVVHTGRQIAGQDRYGVGLINVTTGELLPWRTRLWEDNLTYVGGIQRAYGGAISPDGSYLIVTSGSGGDRPPINDTAVALPLTGGDFVEPLWISRAFDSIYGVAISEVAVYLGGHFSWMESQTSRDPWPGLDNVGYGTGQGLGAYALGDEVLRREHVGSLSPVNGKALDWNPGSNSFEGNKAMLVTPWGLVAGGDATTQGQQNVGRLAVYPLPSTAVQANDTKITHPTEGRVVVTAEPFTVTGTANATSGVNRVQVEIRDRDRNQYLQDDLVTWGGANTINAVLASPGATTTDWSLTLTIDVNRNLEVMARTVGQNGTQDASKDINKFESFSNEDEAPRASFSSPPSGIVPTTTFTVTGSATDDEGVQSLSYTVRDESNRYLQNDGSASATYNSFGITPDVVGAVNTTWSTEVTVPYEGIWRMQVVPRDVAGQSSLDTFDRTWTVTSTAVAPAVTITAPVAMTPPTAVGAVTITPGSPITFSGTATDDDTVRTVEIQLRNTSTREALASDGTWAVGNSAGWFRVTNANLNAQSTNWSYTTDFTVRPGTYTFSVRATDDLDLTTSTTNQGRLTLNAQIPGDNPPDTSLAVTGTQTGGQSLALNITGSATDDFGVQSVRVSFRDRDTNRYLQANGTMSAAYADLGATLASPGATSTTWSLPLTLPTEGSWDVTAFAFDGSGQQDPTTTNATARYVLYPGDQPPVVVMNLLQPQNGALFTDGRIQVTGRVEDDRQIASAQVAIVNAAGQYLGSNGTFTSTTESWRSAFLNSPGSPGSNYNYTSPVVPAGDYTVRVRGVDNHGFATNPTVDVTVTVTQPPNNPPVAVATVTCQTGDQTTQQEAKAPVCSLDGRSSTDENTTGLTYTWAVGVGTTTRTGSQVSYIYTAPGTFTVTLTVTDEYGLTSTATQAVTIVEPVGNDAPIPALGNITLPNNGITCTGLVCTGFTSSQTTDPNVGDTITRLWDWGDGTPTSTTTSPNSHTFPAAGTYTVTLTVTDGWGKVGTATRVITVGP